MAAQVVAAMRRRFAGTRPFKGSTAAALLLLCASPLMGIALHAQLIRIAKPVAGPATFHPNSVQGSTTLALAATPSGVSFALVNGSTATANNPIAITSTVTMPLDTTVEVYGYFVNAASALIGNASSANIPTSAMYGIVPTGLPTAYTAFTQTGAIGAAGSSLKLVSVGGITAQHTQTDNLTLRIDLSGITIPADTYVGTLYLQAQAF
jgi:hypothetical protein